MLNRTIIIAGLLSSLLACGGGTSSPGKTEEITPTPDPEIHQPEEQQPEVQQPSQAELAELASALNSINPASHKAIVDLAYQSPAFSIQNSGIKFSASSLPNWAVIDSNTGSIKGTATTADVHAGHELILTATRGLAQVSLESSLTVQYKESLLIPDSLDFNSTDFAENPRPLVNHLSGDLAGQVKFVQSHSVAPNNNFERNTGDETQSRYMPRLVALRDALLLFNPDTTHMPINVDVEVSLNGEALGHYPMTHPYALYKSDYEGPINIEYSHSAWSVELPWDVIRNGMSLKFTSNQDSASEVSGELIAANIDIGEASQIILQSIRLGMLTHVDKVAGHFTLNNPWSAAADYFQTVPVSKLVVASYADMELSKTIVADGTIYDTASAGDGGVYSGDMRESVAKSQVSTGINLANFGITSNNNRQSYPHLFKQVTNHHAWGNYQNGRQGHGLSGGNGIGTLYNSWGNEASHEWGHGYGLGHYPGSSLTEDQRWKRHHADSGWGFIAHRNRLRSSLYSGIVESSPEHYKGIYRYHHDAMSGGSNSSRFSVYTYHTGYSARIIQNHLERFPLADSNFASGYKKWDESTGSYLQFDYPAEDQRLAAQQVGVPVATILGGYDPTGASALIYPVFHGNYGNVFDLPAPDLTQTDGICWLAINNTANQPRKIALAGTRHHSGSINQLHINVAADYLPTSASVTCRRMGTDVELASTEFDGIIPALPELAIVGQEAGYVGLRANEMVQLSEAFSAISMETIPSLSLPISDLLASYSAEELTKGLTAEAKTVWQNYVSQQQTSIKLKFALQQLMQKQTTMAEKALQMRAELVANGILAEGQSMPMEGYIIQGPQYFTAELDAGGYLDASTEAVDAGSWIVDAQGRIHLASQPSMCILATGSRLGLASCEVNSSAQLWTLADNSTIKNGANNKCVDFDRVNSRLITYGCHAGWNQQWRIDAEAKSDNLLLALWAGSDLETLYQLLQH
ncbi:MAG: M66 family metalloprotease [Oleispira sp.]